MLLMNDTVTIYHKQYDKMLRKDVLQRYIIENCFIHKVERWGVTNGELVNKDEFKVIVKADGFGTKWKCRPNDLLLKGAGGELSEQEVLANPLALVISSVDYRNFGTLRHVEIS